jgi:cytochrome P450
MFHLVSDLPSTVFTSQEHNYRFTSIIPKKYNLVASHPLLTIAQNNSPQIQSWAPEKFCRQAKPYYNILSLSGHMFLGWRTYIVNGQKDLQQAFVDIRNLMREHPQATQSRMRAVISSLTF